MGLYNILFGTSPGADHLLHMIGMKRSDTGRFRDCYAAYEEGEPRILVFTRNGGTWRESCRDQIQAMRSHHLFVREFSDPYGMNYTTFVFKVPALCESSWLAAARLLDNTPPIEKLMDYIQNMEDPRWRPVQERAMEHFAPAMERAMKEGGDIIALMRDDD